MPAKRTTLPPELVAEWADSRSLSEVRVSEKVLWKCHKGHTWYAKVNSRIRDRMVHGRLGCAVCSGVSKKDIPADLLKEWADARDSSTISKKDATAKWICKYGHTYSKSINNRIYKKSGCTICGRNGPAVLPEDLISEWYDTRTVSQVRKSDKTAKWRCNAGHYWCQSITNRVTLRRGCPTCGGTSKRTELPPGLASEWADSRLVSDVKAKDNSVKWRCAFGHEWLSSLGSRLAGHGCHICTKRGKRTSLPENLANEWHDHRSILNVPVSALVTWRCSNGHTWKARINHRIRGSGCPHCAGLFPIAGRIQTQARAIAAHIPRFTPACDLAVLAAHGITELEGADNLHEYLTECHKNPTTSASTIAERFAADKSPKKKSQSGEPGQDPAGTPGQPSSKTLARSGSDVYSPVKPPPTEVSVREQHERNRATLDSLPADLDTQRYQLIVDTIVSAYWAEYAALESQVRNGQPPTMTIKKFVAMQRAEATSSNNFSAQVAGEWIKQHDGAASLKLPRGFKPPFPLMMMQRLVAYHLSQRDVLGNWSAPGAGKTMAGLFAAAVLGSKLTVVICPLGVVSTWQRAIEMSGYTAEGGTDALMWTPSDKASILIVNYDRLHVDSDAAEVGKCQVTKQIQAFAETHGKKVGLLIFDECHRGKNDGETGQGGKSKNRAGLELLRSLLPAAKLLIQTGTPVLTGVREGISILKLLDDKIEEKRQLDREDSVMSAINLHMALIHYGIRFKPDYGVVVGFKVGPVTASRARA